VSAGFAAKSAGGVRIGRYRLRQIIGRGGSSVVYRALNNESNVVPAVVALKIAVDERCLDPEFCRQFHEQARVSAAVDHPCVLPVVDSGDHQGRPYLVMPHIVGADLSKQLTRQALTVGRVLLLLRQVADGLDAMHRAGVLHLDVKPSNVLVGRMYRDDFESDVAEPDLAELDIVDPGFGVSSGVRGPVERAYLTDLGLCRYLADGSLRGGQSGQSPDFVGSPRYASPEHLRGRPVRPSADIYALTCMLFASLAGRPPYTGDVPAVVTGHLSGLVPSLSALTSLPRRLDGVIRRGMHPDPASRFSTCAALITAARLAILDGV